MRVATPKGVCEGIAQTVIDLATKPTAEQVDTYATAVNCLVQRRTTYPAEWWDRISLKEGRKYFDEWLATLP